MKSNKQIIRTGKGTHGIRMLSTKSVEGPSRVELDFLNAVKALEAGEHKVSPLQNQNQGNQMGFAPTVKT